MGHHKNSLRLGLNLGYMVVTGANIVNEVESMKILFDADAVPVAAGGVGGMEGSIVLAVDCDNNETARQIMTLARQANQRAPIKVKRKKCSQCQTPCLMNEKL